MEKKHPKHRAIAKAIISHPLYQRKKAASKMPHRYDMWEDSVVGGLHIFEWIVVGLISMVVFSIVAITLTNGFAAVSPQGCSGCKSVVTQSLQ
ncbi:hypothetical protein P148_SR1C00001G0580 [candidate division SR1 bacterium RAAC1_SR1_1]|nr:hypothetical protein P148_SR1C00001G0580 [candidate division SR1 bacterium RAAC1_SR1_1]